MIEITELMAQIESAMDTELSQYLADLDSLYKELDKLESGIEKEQEFLQSKIDAGKTVTELEALEYLSRLRKRREKLVEIELLEMTIATLEIELVGED